MSEHERMDGVGPGEFPGDKHGAGTAERGRDRTAGRGERRDDAAADMPSEGLVGGQMSAAESAADILDTGRDADRGRDAGGTGSDGGSGSGRSIPRGTDEQPPEGGSRR